MKVFDKKKDVFTLINIEEAEMYLNSKGYFGDSIKELNDNIKQGFDTELEEIVCNDDATFAYKGKGKPEYNSLFLPIEKVRVIEEKKKWRAFKNCDEFLKKTKIAVGTVIHIKTSPNFVDQQGCYHLALLGYTNDTLIFPSPLNEISFQKLFIGVQLIEEDGTLQPFGVEE